MQSEIFPLVLNGRNLLGKGIKSRIAKQKMLMLHNVVFPRFSEVRTPVAFKFVFCEYTPLLKIKYGLCFHLLSELAVTRLVLRF